MGKLLEWFKEINKASITIETDPKLKKDDYVCTHCKYGWTTKKSFGCPAFCPRCKSNSIIKVDRN